ncbi:MAG: hypothetical protein ABW221_14660 [Vicinamibacteria bacterium]
MRISSGLVAIVLTGWLAPSMRAEAPARPDLSGTWRFDPTQSEDARAKLREMRGDRGERPRGGRFGGGGGGRPMGGGPGGGRGGPGAAAGDNLREQLDAPPALTVTQTPTEITLLEEDGRLRVLHPDGRAYKNSEGREVKTRWSEAGELVSETKGERGRIVETFSAAKDPARLLVTLLLEVRGQALAVRRVYVRPQDAPAAAPPGELPPPTPPKLK